MRQILAILGVFTLIIGLWLACWFRLKYYIPNQAERGQFGDQFGAVNSLFAGLAFAAVVVTLVYQHRDSRRQEQRFRAELAHRKQESTAEEKRFKAELARREQELAKQIRLGALSSYAELSKELWQHCEREWTWCRDHNDIGGTHQWDRNRKARYEQTMQALAELEKGGIL